PGNGTPLVALSVVFSSKGICLSSCIHLYRRMDSRRQACCLGERTISYCRSDLIHEKTSSQTCEQMLHFSRSRNFCVECSIQSVLEQWFRKRPRAAPR